MSRRKITTDRRRRVALLETFDNPHPERNYEVEIVQPEFTSLCPRTGQPDFGRITIRYVPGRRCVELKSLKFYLQSYRPEGIFYEDVTNVILNDLVALLRPKRIEVVSEWRPRGGIRTTVRCVHTARGGRGLK